jgi:hypothetical protein
MIALKLPASLLDHVRADLRRSHPFAHERVGFLKARQGALPGGGVLLLVWDYLAVADEAYIEDDSVGARITDAGFRPARQAALSERASILHVHLHDLPGRARPSGIDSREAAHFMPDFVKLAPSVPHAAIVLSSDSASGRAWYGENVEPIARITVVGAPLRKTPYA